MFEGWFGKDRRVAAARKAELRGDLKRALDLWSEAGAPSEVARVMLLRGDAEADPKRRLQHYTQAVAAAPMGHAVRALAVKKRALLVIALAGEGNSSAIARHDVLGAARDLESVGEQEAAAEAYARAGDVESEARALAQAGNVEKLETLLTDHQTKDREDRRRREGFAEIVMLVASGRRREAIAAAEALASVARDSSGARISALPSSGSDAARDRASQLRARRAMGPIARLVVDEEPLALIVGQEVTIGRTEGTLQIASQAISRKHLAIARNAAGDVVVRDLGSRNGTLLRGLGIGGDVSVGQGIDLKLGKEVAVRIAPSPRMSGAVQIEVGGARYVATLGPSRLAIADLPQGAWSLEQASDGWLELVSDQADDGGAHIHDVRLVPRATLLVGDEIAITRRARAVLRVVG